MRAVLRKVPILADVNLPVREFQQMSRGQLVDSGEDGDRVWYVAVIQVFEEALRVDFGQFRSHGQDRLDLRGEVELIAELRIMQRLLAETISRQDKLPRHLVINGQPKHATELFDTVGTHLFVEVNDDFCIRLGIEAVTAAFQRRAKFGEIVDLPVINDPRSAVFVENRLMASGQVDDAQAAHSESRVVGDEDAFVIGTAVDDLIAHSPHESVGNVARPRCAYHSGDSTHERFLYSLSVASEAASTVEMARFRKSLKR